MFWATLGVGALVNTVDDVDESRFVSRMQQQSMHSLRERFMQAAQKSGSQAVDYSDNPSFDSTLEGDTAACWDWAVPDYPQEAAASYYAMQRRHRLERQQAVLTLQQLIAQMKDDYFEEYHYLTKVDEVGNASLDFSSEGLPQIADLGEDPEEKGVRERFERAASDRVLNQQEDEKEAFILKQRHELLAYLRSNEKRLDDKEIQDMLVRMIRHIKKAAIFMVQKHENELWRIALPDNPELLAEVDEQIAALRVRDQQQLELEENAPEIKEIIAYEEQTAQAVREQKAILRSKHQEEFFLLAPQAMMNLQYPGVDLAELFPPYLLSILYSLSIYSLEDT